MFDIRLDSSVEFSTVTEVQYSTVIEKVQYKTKESTVRQVSSTTIVLDSTRVQTKSL